MPPVADDDHKRRARRRLIGAVALTIVAVIILPLVLEDKPPPAGPLQVHMPQSVQPATNIPQNSVEYAPPSPNTVVEPSEPEKIEPVQAANRQESGKSPAQTAKTVIPADKPIEQQGKAEKTVQTAVAYTVQVGVFADKANVQRLQSQISSLGLKSYTDSLDGSTRVRVGSFKDRTEAERMLAKLASAGIKGQVVEK